MKDEKKPSGVVVATNHEAFRDYFILESFEVGIVLVGCEVKSLRQSKASLSGSFARIEEDEVYLHNFHIAPYEMGNRANPEPLRERKLLLRRPEIEKLKGKTQLKGLTLIPFKIYFNKKGLLKVELALAKGKNLFDKRSDIKKKVVSREIDRAIKNRNTK